MIVYYILADTIDISVYTGSNPYLYHLFYTLISTYTGYAVVHGNMSIGNWIAVQSWVTSVFAPLNYLGMVRAACTVYIYIYSKNTHCIPALFIYYVCTHIYLYVLTLTLYLYLLYTLYAICHLT